jgi:cytidylate kinase
VSQKLNLDFINFTFRNLAEEKHKTLPEVLEAAKTDDFWDRETDRRQTELARNSTGCVLGSRLAIWLLPEAGLKVYLFADTATRARRILAREGGLLEEVKQFTQKRDGEDHERYLQLYSIDNNDYSFVDMVIDTAKYTAEEIADQIVERAKCGKPPVQGKS